MDKRTPGFIKRKLINDLELDESSWHFIPMVGFIVEEICNGSKSYKSACALTTKVILNIIDEFPSEIIKEGSPFVGKYFEDLDYDKKRKILIKAFRKTPEIILTY
jgi:hypothetical protein